MSLRWIAVFALVFVPSARAQAYSSAHAPIFMPLDLEIPDSPKAAGIFFVGALLMLVGAYLLLTM